MNRGKNPKFSIPHSAVDFTVAVLGAGAAAPTVPADGPFTPATSTYPVRANGVSKAATEVPSRTSAGLYVITIDHQLPNILFATAAVVAGGAAPTGGLSADVTVINAATRQITVQVNTITSGAATDIGTSDLLLLSVDAQDSNA